MLCYVTPKEHLALPDKERSEEHTSELQSRETISYAVFCYGESAKNYRDLYPDEEGTLLLSLIHICTLWRRMPAWMVK